MKRVFFATWMLLLGIMSEGVWASEGNQIDVQIIAHSQGPDRPSSVVTVLIRNLGSGPVFIARALSPLVTPQGHLMTNIFEVHSADGGETKFIGRHVRVSPVNPSTFFIKIDPGQSASHDMDLAADYDLSRGGAFVIRYDQSYSTNYHMNDEGEIDSDLHFQSSEIATINVSQETASAISKSFAFAPASDPAQQCTAAQKDIIGQAMWTGNPIVYAAQQGIESLYSVKENPDPSGYPTYQGQLTQDNAYTYWFGAPVNNTAIHYAEPSYTDFWKTDDDYVMMRFMNSVFLRAGTGSVMCGCDPVDYPDTAAWTEDENLVVHYCDKFFALKMINGTSDSQVLTVIHELSHFIDMWGPGTGDYAYGQSGSNALTVSNRAKAVRNADNLMYYIGKYVH